MNWGKTSSWRGVNCTLTHTLHAHTLTHTHTHTHTKLLYKLCAMMLWGIYAWLCVLVRVSVAPHVVLPVNQAPLSCGHQKEHLIPLIQATWRHAGDSFVHSMWLGSWVIKWLFSRQWYLPSSLIHPQALQSLQCMVKRLRGAWEQGYPCLKDYMWKNHQYLLPRTFQLELSKLATCIANWEIGYTEKFKFLRIVGFD